MGGKLTTFGFEKWRRQHVNIEVGCSGSSSYAVAFSRCFEIFDVQPLPEFRIDNLKRPHIQLCVNIQIAWRNFSLIHFILNNTFHLLYIQSKKLVNCESVNKCVVLIA